MGLVSPSVVLDVIVNNAPYGIVDPFRVMGRNRSWQEEGRSYHFGTSAGGRVWWTPASTFEQNTCLRTCAVDVCLLVAQCIVFILRCTTLRQVVYQEYKVTWPMSNRDFVFLRWQHCDEKGVWYNVCRSLLFGGSSIFALSPFGSMFISKTVLNRSIVLLSTPRSLWRREIRAHIFTILRRFSWLDKLRKNIFTSIDVTMLDTFSFSSLLMLLKRISYSCYNPILSICCYWDNLVVLKFHFSSLFFTCRYVCAPDGNGGSRVYYLVQMDPGVRVVPCLVIMSTAHLPLCLLQGYVPSSIVNSNAKRVSERVQQIHDRWRKQKNACWENEREKFCRWFFPCMQEGEAIQCMRIVRD